MVELRFWICWPPRKGYQYIMWNCSWALSRGRRTRWSTRSAVRINQTKCWANATEFQNSISKICPHREKIEWLRIICSHQNPIMDNGNVYDILSLELRTDVWLIYCFFDSIINFQTQISHVKLKMKKLYFHPK